MTPDDGRSRPGSIDALLGVLLFLGVTAMVGGVGLLAGVIDPPASWLAGSPFSNYLVPAVALFVALGALPVLVATWLYRGSRWGWIGSLVVGLAAMAWLVAQAEAIGWGNGLQWFYLGVGVVLLSLPLLPSVRRYGGRTRNERPAGT